MASSVSHSNSAPALMWFRQDLRLGDNPALSAAVASGRPVVCVYVLDDVSPGEWIMGGASRWWLHQSLTSLVANLAEKGAELILRLGDASEVIIDLADAIGAAEVHWNRCYEPFAVERDRAVKDRLKAAGVKAESHNGALLFEPWEIKTGAGDPYRVFTPFWRACRAQGLPTATLPTPTSIPASKAQIASDALHDWALQPTKPDWAGGIRDAWTVGEASAHGRLTAFLQRHVCGYKTQRNLPGVHGTSRLSPHMHFGEISPRQVASRVLDHMAEHGEEGGANTFLSEIGWREFSHSLLYHNPDFPNENFQAKFDNFPWTSDDTALDAWQRGETGYPIVDAGMRELWTTGWMHNRVRMIVGSFLVKHLLIDWRQGERWFWDTLVDADLANNAAGWQWIAGSGADAAPYFRIFNPMTQGEKFDSDGAYVRRWISELAKLPTKHIHLPWTASATELRDAGVTLGDNYPDPIVDHARARQRALEAFDSLKTPA